MHDGTPLARALLAAPLAAVLLVGCGDDSEDGPSTTPRTGETRTALETRLRESIVAASGGLGLEAYRLPTSDDFARIPQDPANPLTSAKVALGQMLFHDTAFALDGRGDEAQSWSCATCHHAAAGFKSGTLQGIGEGGIGFGVTGSDRTLDPGFDAGAPEDDPRRPDLQPVASPTVLNGAYQDVMLWNGQFGNAPGGINAGVDPTRLVTEGTPKAANAEGLSGLETQALAGLGVHRLRVTPDTELQTNPDYVALWEAAYPDGSDDITRDAAKAIAAFERTVLADRAPFQRWLRGERGALDEASLRGGVLFFGKAGCVDCHRGPALSSELGADAGAQFQAVGFADLDASGDPRVHGTVDEATRRGRGGFTGDPLDDYRFNVPTLYNLADTDVFGHGASFGSVRDVVALKNAGTVQNEAARAAIDPRVRPLGLSETEIDDLSAFLERALRDPELDRYQPETVPSGRCVIVDAFDLEPDGRCPMTPADQPVRR